MYNIESYSCVSKVGEGKGGPLCQELLPNLPIKLALGLGGVASSIFGRLTSSLLCRGRSCAEGWPARHFAQQLRRWRPSHADELPRCFGHREGAW